MHAVVFLLLMVNSGLLYAAEAQSNLLSEHDFSGNIEFGGFQTTGNAEVTTFDGKVELTHDYGKLTTEFLFEATQTSDAGALTSDNYETTLKEEYAFGYNAYVFALLGYREDLFSGIIYEKTQLVGAGYHAFTDEPSYAVDIEIGYGARETDKVLKKKLDHDPGVHVAVEATYFWSDKDALKVLIKSESGNDDAYIKAELEWKHKLIENFSIDFNYTQRKHVGSEVRQITLNSKATVKLGYAF